VVEVISCLRNVLRPPKEKEILAHHQVAMTAVVTSQTVSRVGEGEVAVVTVATVIVVVGRDLGHPAEREGVTRSVG